MSDKIRIKEPIDINRRELKKILYLLKFIQSKIGGRKNASYYGFLKAIGEENLPAFKERQEAFVKYVSEMLPIVRPYEYLII